jgi:hypothetical protein
LSRFLPHKKALKSFLHSLTICDKVASGNNSYLSKDNVKLLSKFNKDGRMRESLINRIQLLTAEIPISFREFETDYRYQDKPDLEEAFCCLGDRERNLRAKTSCVKGVSTYLAKSGENL